MTNFDRTIEGASSGNVAEVTSDQELKVKDSNTGIPDGGIQIQEAEGFGTARNKIEYTVPVGKVLYITGWTLTNWEGKLQLEWQIDTNIFDGAGLNETGNTFASRSVSPSCPIATAVAGEEVRARRESGDSGKPWFASLQGYLLDA